MFQAAVSQSLFLWLFFSSLNGCFSSVVDSFFGIVHCAFDDSTSIVGSISSRVNSLASSLRSRVSSLASSFRSRVSSGVECFTSIVESFFRSSSSRINRFVGRFEGCVSGWVSFFFWRASGESQRSCTDDHDVLHCNTPVVGQMTGKAHSTSRSLLKVHLSRSRVGSDR